MLFLHDYISQFRTDGLPNHADLADVLQATKDAYDIFKGSVPMRGFTTFVKQYEWLGNPQNKKKYDIGQNLARNLPGALMQDYLLHLMMEFCRSYPQLDVFAEVKVAFGNYPLWEMGKVKITTPSEKSDLAIGYLSMEG